jgi:hypothetical protein
VAAICGNYTVFVAVSWNLIVEFRWIGLNLKHFDENGDSYFNGKTF